jgi:hypothetical protein
MMCSIARRAFYKTGQGCRASGYPGEKATINPRNPNGVSERRNGKFCNPFGVEMAMVTFTPG